MKLLDEIRQQPMHVRKMFMWGMVVLTFSSLGVVWVNSTKDKVVALLNPETAKTIDGQEGDSPSSPFAFLKDSWDSLKANISSLGPKQSTTAPSTVNTPEPVPPQELP